jgi:hypothetical protein
MAKYLEHRAKDYIQAKELIETAFAGNNAFSADERTSLLHRLQRLNTRLEVSR